jgi:hypothetical protein
MARIPTTVEYKKVIIEHPEDIKYLLAQDKKAGEEKKPGEKKGVGTNANIDDKKSPSGHTKHRVLDIPKGRLHFNALIEPERHFTEIEVERNPNKPPKRTKSGEKENLGVTEGDSKNKSRKVDFKSLADPHAVPSDFFKHIRLALQHIQDTKNWQINERTGELSHEKQKSFLTIAGGAKRRYFLAEITWFDNPIANILEIDLTDKHGLSTVVLQLAPDSGADIIDEILNALVDKSGRWDKERIHELTDMCAYVVHPKSLSEETEKLVYENWASRIISEL